MVAVVLFGEEGHSIGDSCIKEVWLAIRTLAAKGRVVLQGVYSFLRGLGWWENIKSRR